MYIDDILKIKFPKIDSKFFTPLLSTTYTLILLFIIAYSSYNYITTHNNKFLGLIFVILIIYVVLIIINKKMETNIYYSNKYVEPEKIVNQLHTGDIVLFRCYEYDDLGTWAILSIPLLQNTYSTHIGMIYKDDNGKIFIVESNGNQYFCEMTKKEKSGTQFLEFVNRVNNTKVHRIHVIKSDLYKYIDKNKLKESINKYKDYGFFENGVYCIKLIVNILIENGVLKKENWIDYLMDDLVDPHNYTVPVKFEEPIKVREPDFDWL